MRGRLVSSNPAEGEQYYLHLLLSHVNVPTCFKDLYMVNGLLHPTFRKASLERGLIEHDDNLSQCFAEAFVFQFPNILRRLFALILIYCEPRDVRKLWEDHYNSLFEDYMRVNIDVNLQDGGFREVQEEYSIVVEDEHLQACESLNLDQKFAFDEIMRHVENDCRRIFFIDGPSRTGKTFLYKALLVEVRSRGLVALATASSGVATNNMSRGELHTLDSRFLSICIITQYATLTTKTLTDQWFSEFLLRVGDGDEETIDDTFICIPNNMAIPYNDKGNSTDALIDAIFPSLQINGDASNYIISRAILSTKNNNVNEINNKLIDRFCREEKVYYSLDEAQDDKNNLYLMKFLSSLTVNGLPSHYLRLKIGCTIILLRNIDPLNGLCNGKRLICKWFQHNVIDAEIALVNMLARGCFC
ncbi:uncharacterized protein LOC112523821 [Cynara cardunculus var. scolymus]|uniref:uncharacterized protein LOC112523821 n=1 Tax=Cynara cardunculus var. scolymus TaxID=59895 RepID=UPI000D625EBD|nr:uncharacterized protein LOC112523821 [Cynara cardunculus var. scolymus]